MKRLMYICLAFCLATTVATAQKVTQKDLQGSWKMVAMDASGIYLDLASGEVTVAPELEAQLTAEDMDGIKQGMKEAVAPLSKSSISFDGANFNQNVGDQTLAGTYNITDRDNKQYLSLNINGTPGEAEVAMADNKLRITQGNGMQQATFIYTKQ